MSIRVQDRSLRWILGEISRKSGVYITSDEIENQVISIEFSNLPLEEGLRKVLSGFDLFIFYDGVGQPFTSLKAAWVYRKGWGEYIAPLPADKWVSTLELEQNLLDQSPIERAQAVEALVKRMGKQALDVVLEALQDEDEQVRNRVIDVALNFGVELPKNILMDLTRYDTSAFVQSLALSGIARHLGDTDVLNSDIRAIAESVLNGPNSHIKAQAKQILEQLDTDT